METTDMRTIFIAVILLLVGSVQAHMQLNYPPTFNASNNPHRSTVADPYLQYPYDCCGRTTPFPCRGYLSLLGTPDGAPVASWPAGSVQNFSLSGIGNHYGGSCQVGCSVDNGTTWKVATSFESNCPYRNGGEDPANQTFHFTVPKDIPTGDHLFAWVWYNREQEMNMNCAAVSLTPAGAGTGGPAALSASASSSGPSAQTSSSAAPPLSYTDSNGCTCTCPAVGLRRDMKHGLLPGHDYQLIGRQGYAGSSVPQSLTAPSASPVAWNDRPQMLFADMNNGCMTPHTTAEVKYPNPGPDVVPGDGAYPLETPGPVDKCQL